MMALLCFLKSYSLCFVVYIVCLLTCSVKCTIPKDHFSTKTPYAWAHPPRTDENIEDELYTLPDLKGMACSAVHVSLVARHGTRNPGLDDIHDISELHESLVAAMDLETHPELYNWKNPFPDDNKKALTHVGENELEMLGQRTARRLNSLLAEEDISNFRFMSSSQDRAKRSTAAFFEGFNAIVNAEEDDEFDTEINDDLLRFFDLCARYVYDVKDNKTSMKEWLDFLSSDRVLKIKDKISKRLGITNDLLTPAKVRLMYLICGYETAIHSSSPWCSLLDPEDFGTLEYLGDLKHYYKSGYAFNISWLSSCPLVSEIFYSMDEAILEIESSTEEEEVGNYVVGQFAFAHAETLAPLYTSLGLFNDTEPLKADNFETHQNRKFKTSEILPFAANIMFVLYECVPEEFGQEEEIDEADYYVKVLVNEKPVILPGCQEVHCSYNTVRKSYNDLVEKCNFKKLCRRSDVKDEL